MFDNGEMAQYEKAKRSALKHRKKHYAGKKARAKQLEIVGITTAHFFTKIACLVLAGCTSQSKAMTVVQAPIRFVEDCVVVRRGELGTGVGGAALACCYRFRGAL